MEFKTYGFGLYGWHGDGLAIVGGIREDGFHGAGTLRCGFVIHDVRRAGPDGSALRVGKASLVVRLAESDDASPAVEKLINIEFGREHRRSGYGRRTVAAIAQLTGGKPLEICDIKKGAEPFWRKVGAVDFVSRGKHRHALLPAAQAAHDVQADDGSAPSAPKP